MIEKTKKTLAKLLITSLLLVYVLQPVAIFADEEEIVDPTPTPVETQTEIDNSTVVETTVVTDSNTGENEITEPTPTPTTEADKVADLSSTSASPTPTPELDTATATESASVNSTCQQEEENEENNEDEDSNSIETGDAVSTTVVENDVNSTSINSEVEYQIINIIYDQEGDVDLSDPIAIATKALSEKPNEEIITVKATGISNFAYVSNDIITTAQSGENSITTASGSASIDTGDAYATTLLLNKVNFITINSVVHVVMINIYGDINGDIILPNIQTEDTTCDTCGVSILADNNAVVENNVKSEANTGENTIVTASGSASIETGDAGSLVDNLNIVNSNYLGVGIQTLYINTYGEWNGDFIGWGAIGPQLGGGSLDINYVTAGSGNEDCDLCTGDMYLKNNAIVSNNILSSANTGGNLINGDDSNIKTGNAYSTVSILNFINTNIINSIGFFGFINIFGRLNGDIGGKAEFEALAVEDNTDNNNEDNQTKKDENILAGNSLDNSYLRENGGKLEVEQTNNVGEYVLPGDTVTFFVKIKNTGTGKVYESKLALFLIKDGVNVGGTEFDLGVIEPGKMVKVSTGLVLSPNTPGGQYIARAYAIGKAGEEEDDVSSFADSTFKVFGVYAPIEEVLGEKTKDIPPVLGASTNTRGITGGANSMAAFFAFLILLELYILLRILRQKEKIRQIFTRGIPLMARLTALKMFLL